MQIIFILKSRVDMTWFQCSLLQTGLWPASGECILAFCGLLQLVSSTLLVPISNSDLLQVNTAAETARRRQLRQCYPASHSDIHHGHAQHQPHEADNSNFLERRPKVQIASKLQGCTTEPVPQPTHHSGRLLDGSVLLLLLRCHLRGMIAARSIPCLL